VQLDDLLAPDPDDPKRVHGGVCVVRPGLIDEAARAYFEQAVMALEHHRFWNVAETRRQYRPEGGLWAPQRRAVGVCLAYLGAWLSGKTKESALVKMPTGTGKTSVIATLACALPQVRRTLIVTPRRTLVTQMLADVHWRIWQNFDLAYDGTSLRKGKLGPTVPERESEAAGVIRLLPSHAERILLNKVAPERLIVVSTFAALEQVLRPEEPPHRLTGRRARHSFGHAPEQASEAIDERLAQRITRELSTFDLVLIDEGHYEPAFVWSQCVRKLARPTVLFSATPYRNDFKFFAVRGNFAFNLGFSEARDRKLIRPMRFCDEQVVPAQSGNVSAFVKSLDAYYSDAIAKSAWPADGPAPRVIVRAENYQSLEALKQAFDQHVGAGSAVLIHEKAKKNNAKALTFESASAALAADETKHVRYWLHQWKLLEGVDEKQFACVAVYEPFGSSRQVIQQIGRVLRFLDFKGTPGETATVFASAPVLADLKARFQRYCAFEDYFNVDPGRALVREARLPSEILKAVAPYQYLFGDFRERMGLDDEHTPRLADFKVPFRASVFRNAAGRSLDDLATGCLDAIDIEDRFESRIVCPAAKEPKNVRLVMYLSWRNADVLTRHSLPVWNLGLMVLVSIKQRVFLHDTEGLVIDLDKLGLELEPTENLRRLIPAGSATARSRVAEASAAGLDLSESAIRSVSVRKYDLSAGFYDLSQSNQALRNLKAYSYEGKTARSRYLSLDRSSVSDADRSEDKANQSIADFAVWAKRIAEALDSNVPENRVFSQFAATVSGLPAADAKPQNLLLDLLEMLEAASPETRGWDPEKVRQLREAELCLDVGDDGKVELPVGTGKIECFLKYVVSGTVHRRGRYEFEGKALDACIRDPKTPAGEPASLAAMINKEQAFRVLPYAPDLTYANKVFYRTGINIEAIRSGHELGTPLESMHTSKWMAHVRSEKGKGDMSEWVDGSIFGGMYAQFDRPNFGARLAGFTARPLADKDADLAKELATFDIVVCDDGGKERADFMLVSEQLKRVVFVHAKVNDSQFSLNSVQVVGRQALAGLAFMTRGYRDTGRADWWDSAWKTDGTRTVSQRILVSPKRSHVATWAKIQEALLSNSYAKEIWIWIGRSLSKASFVSKLTEPTGPRPEALQMAAYLGSLQTAAARAHVRTRIWCSQ
jgi:hypothetical protein